VTGSCRARLVVFAKEPAPGRVKTRLAAAIGPGRAAALYEAFLTDLAASLVAPEWESVVSADGGGAGRLEQIFASGWSRVAQGSGSLGDRLARAAASAFGDGARKVAVAGSDAPTLSVADVLRAFDVLDRADVAAAPSPDGGFSLAALRIPVDPSGLFRRVRWSTAEALPDLRRNAAAARIGLALLPEIPDVDVPGDLPALRRRLSAEEGLAPATKAVLETL
jgi:rSAM/selenodomain-associated transferase 1